MEQNSNQEKKSPFAKFLVKCIIWITVIATIMIIYWSLKLFYIGNTFR